MRTTGGRAAALLIAIAAVLTAPPGIVDAAAPLPTLGHAPDAVAQRAGVVPSRLIVRWQHATPAAARAAALAAAGAVALHGLGGLDMELLDVGGQPPDAVARALVRSGRVRYVEPDRYVTFSADPTQEPWFDQLWGLQNTGQTVQGFNGTADVDVDMPQAAQITMGKASVVVAVIDDGVDFSHPELVDRAWRNPGETGNGRATNGIDDDGDGLIDDVNGWDFLNNDASVHDWEQDFHGTHVAGIIAASLNGQDGVGVAPAIRIMALKFGDTSGGTTSNAIEAINYAAAHGADLMNASWGGTGESMALRDAIAASGILMIAAAGNDGVDNDTSPMATFPASYDLPNVLAVGAADADGQLASFSNYGATTVDLVAPGVNILSAYPATSTNPPAGLFLDGTSMAAPHVTGAAALVVALRPWLATYASTLRQRLLRSGKPMPATAGLTKTGKMVDAFWALDFDPPTATGPTIKLAQWAANPAGDVAVRVDWSAADGGSGLERYKVQLRTDGGAWQAVWLPGPLTESIVRRLAPGHNYQFRVRAWDRAGNATAWIEGPTRRLLIRNEAWGTIAVSGTWTRPAVASAIGGHLRRSDEANATAEMTFTGRSIGWVAERSPGYGRAEVYIDGAKVATIDLEATTDKPRRVVFMRNWTTSQTHTIQLRVLGTAGRPTVDLDAFTLLV